MARFGRAAPLLEAQRCAITAVAGAPRRNGVVCIVAMVFLMLFVILAVGF